MKWDIKTRIDLSLRLGLVLLKKFYYWEIVLNWFQNNYFFLLKNKLLLSTYGNQSEEIPIIDIEFVEECSLKCSSIIDGHETHSKQWKRIVGMV